MENKISDIIAYFKVYFPGIIRPVIRSTINPEKQLKAIKKDVQDFSFLSPDKQKKLLPKKAIKT